MRFVLVFFFLLEVVSCLSVAVFPLSSRRRTHQLAASASGVAEVQDVPTRDWSSMEASKKICGVYVVRDSTGRVTYVGASTDVTQAVEGHRRRFGDDTCASVRVVEKPTSTRPDDLEKMRERVVASLPAIPEGNLDDRWTEIVSPFENGEKQKTLLSSSMEFNLANVDKVLDEVRPMLVADGGNVEVASIKVADKSVVLILKGACGSCPSATTTMKQGLEVALKNAWPDLGSVTRLDDLKLTAAAAEKLLDPIRSAFTTLGAEATVLSANLLGPGVVELEYKGPDNIRYGIELSLLDSPQVTKVIWYTRDQHDNLKPV